MQSARTGNTCPSDANGRIRVAVWSSFQPLVRELTSLIDRSRDFVVVERSPNPPAPHAGRTSAAHVLVLDVDAAPAGARQLLEETLRSRPWDSILAVSAHVDPRFAAAVLRAGATGYLLKDRAYEELTDAVRAVARGDCYISSLDDVREDMSAQGVEKPESGTAR